MTRTNHMGLRALLLTAAVAVAVFALGSCSHGERERSDGSHDTAASAERQRSNLGRARGTGPQVRIELPRGAWLASSSRTQLAGAARQFATSLTCWLYGDRREIDVQPIGPEVRRQLTNAPPYVPPDQIGSSDGQAIDVRVFVQARRSGVLVVAIRDSRTTYTIAASFELRRGHWEVVHLNTD